MTGLFRTRQPFLQTNSWQNQALNSLRYNTSQPGSVIPVIIGQVRQQVNVIDFGNYNGPQGKKGKVGPLPITGTPNASKGGGGSKGKGKKSGTGKKSGNFSVDVMFGMAQGPIVYPNANLVFSSSGVENFNESQLNFYPGTDGQAGDPTFIGLGHTVNYSGTCGVSGTPLILGPSPVLPNLGLELQSADDPGTGGPSFSLDECPGNAIYKVLTNLRYGAGFPVQNLTEIRAVGANTYGDYCQAAQMAISTSLDGQQKCIDWLDAIVRLTNSELVWSGSLLKIIPHGDLTLGANGATWVPNLSPAYALTDDDFLPWDSEDVGSGPKPGRLDPILVTRTNPNDALNWLGIEYLDRSNYYNPTVIPVFDQGAIDTYGLRLGETIQGRAFCNSTSAQVSAQLKLQRIRYVRNSPYKFKLGWKYSLLEPMDIVTLTGSADSGDVYLVNQPVRLLQLEEGEDGGFTIDAEEIQVAPTAPPGRSGPSAPCTAAGSAGGTWNPSDKGSFVQLASGNTKVLIASGGAGNGNGSVRSTTSHASGGVYYEIQGAPGDLTNVLFGIANSTFDINTGFQLGDDKNAVGTGSPEYPYTLAHGTYIDAAKIYAGSPDITDGWFGMAICLDNMMMWFGSMVGDVVQWNNTATANPATGIGGISIAGLAGGPYYIACSILSYGIGPGGGEGNGPYLLITNDNVGSALSSPPGGFSWW